jgi:hypothetical protein
VSIKINSTRSAAVDQANGVACLGTYHARHQWTHWQGLPKFRSQEELG